MQSLHLGNHKRAHFDVNLDFSQQTEIIPKERINSAANRGGVSASYSSINQTITASIATCGTNAANNLNVHIAYNKDK